MIVATIRAMAKTSTPGQARFTSRYTEAQKQAILRAVCVEGNTVAVAIERAKAGQLGIPAFDIGVYAYQLVKRGRDAFEAANDDALAVAIDAELRATAIAAVAHNRAILAAIRSGTKPDPDQLRRSAQALAAIKRARREADNTPKVSKPAAQHATSNEPQPANGGTLSTLLSLASDDAKQGARTGSVSRSINAQPSDSAA